MKKTLMTFGLLGAISGAAWSQSTVSMYGTVDVSGKYVKNDGSVRRLSESTDGLNQSQLGFKGVEDLGGGIKAGFNLVSTVIANTGSTNSRFWNRRSTVSLFSDSLGEFRMGRDYVPTFWNNVIFDAFGGNGIGNGFNVWQLQATYLPVPGPTNLGSPAFGNFARADNSLGYFLPAGLGGVYGQAMVAASQGGTNQGRVTAARVGYAAGPFDIAAAGLQQRFDLASNPVVTGITPGSHQNTYNLGSSYNFGFVKLFGYVVHDTREGIKETRGSLSVSIPVGSGEIHLGYDRSKLTNDLAFNNNTDSEFAAGYVHNLSKRTALYGTAGRLKNGSHPLLGVTQSVAGWNPAFAGTAQTAQPFVGGKSTGFELGIRHFF